MLISDVLRETMKRIVPAILSLAIVFGLGFVAGRVTMQGRHGPAEDDVQTVSFVMPPITHNPDTAPQTVVDSTGRKEFTIPPCEAILLRWTFVEGFVDHPDILELLPGGRIYLPADKNEVIINRQAMVAPPSGISRGFESQQVYDISMGKEDASRRRSDGSSMAVQAQLRIKIE